MGEYSLCGGIAGGAGQGLSGEGVSEAQREPWVILETERLVVREMEEGDLEALYRIYDQRDAADFLDGLSADRDEERAYIKDYIEKVYAFYGFGIWMLEEKSGEGAWEGQAFI